MSAEGDEDPPSLVELRRELEALRQSAPGPGPGGPPFDDPSLDRAAADAEPDDGDPEELMPELDRLARRLTELADGTGTTDRDALWSRIEAQLGPVPPSED